MTPTTPLDNIRVFWTQDPCTELQSSLGNRFQELAHEGGMTPPPRRSTIYGIMVKFSALKWLANPLTSKMAGANLCDERIMPYIVERRGGGVTPAS